MLRLLVLFICIVPTFLNAQHTITARFVPKEMAPFVLLYRMTTSGPVNASGAGKRDENEYYIVPLDSNQVPGLYKLVYSNPTRVKCFYLIYDGKSDIAFTFSQKNGLKFSDDQNDLFAQFSTKKDTFLKKLDLTLIREDSAKSVLDSLVKQFRLYEEEMALKSKGKFVANYINALSIDLPDTIESVSAFKEYRKRYYWTNFKFENPLLQATPYPIALGKNYYDLFAAKSDDIAKIAPVINTIFSRVHNTDISFQFRYFKSFWTFLQENHEALALKYLAKNYFLPFAESQGKDRLKDNLNKFISLSLDEKAPNIIWDAKWNPNLPKSLYDFSGAHFYILAFWESNCSHCKEELPKVNMAMANYSQKLFKVLAIGLERDTKTWYNVSTQFSNFTNVIAVQDKMQEISTDYDVRKLPTYFILDRDKMIISKPYDTQNLLKEMKRLSLKKY